MDTSQPFLFLKHRGAVAFYVISTFVWIYGWMLFSIVSPQEGVSVEEKRSLAPFPVFDAQSVFFGRFFPELSFWFADHFPMRDAFIHTTAVIEPFFGVSWNSIRFSRRTHVHRDVEDDIFFAEELQQWAQLWRERFSVPISRDSLHNEKQGSQPETQHLPKWNETIAQQKPKEHLHIERLDNLFIYGNHGFYIFGGSKKYADRYAQILSKAASLVSGMARVYCLPVPTAVEILLPTQYQSLSTPQRPFMNRVSLGLKQVTFVDVYADLMSQRQKYLYYRTDHHWTPLGAYIAYQKFAAAANYTPNSLSMYQEVSIGRFWGTLYTATQNKTLGAHPDEVVAYRPAGKYRVHLYNKHGKQKGEGSIIYEGARKMNDKYVVFLGGDSPYMEIINQGNARRNKKILVFKESFGNAFVPFLVPDYEEVHVADIRTFPFGLASFVRDHGIHEVLFINNLFAVCDSYRVREIERIVERP